MKRKKLFVEELEVRKSTSPLWVSTQVGKTGGGISARRKEAGYSKCRKPRKMHFPRKIELSRKIELPHKITLGVMKYAPPNPGPEGVMKYAPPNPNPVVMKYAPPNPNPVVMKYAPPNPNPVVMKYAPPNPRRRRWSKLRFWHRRRDEISIRNRRTR